jgi:hypothetical protein
VVLDFWVRAKFSGDDGFSGHVNAASNEGSPGALKVHGGGRRDIFQFEVDGGRDGFGQVQD